MSFELSIARRLYGHREDGQQLSRPAVRIAMWGVAVGMTVMILSVAIILGFKGEIRKKVIGFGGHIEVINYRSLYTAEAQPIHIDEALVKRLEQMQGITHAQRFATKTGMLKTDDTFKGIILRGVAEEYDTTFLAAHLLEGRLPRFSSSAVSNEILISSRMAREMHLQAGDKVYAYFFAEQVKARRFLVAGIYETHLTEFDNVWVFTDLTAAQRLNEWQADQCAGAELVIDDFDALEARTEQVAAVMNRTTDDDGNTYSTHSITELYPGLFSWLKLLDTNVYVILLLMIGLSIFTMTSGLLIIILERTNFIAVMKSLGSPNVQMRRIFLNFAAMLIGKGLLWGNVLGIGLSLLQQHFGIVHLDPATYYVDAVPIQLSWPLILLLNVATLFLTLLVLIVPAHLVSRIHPAQVMRFE
ncbi:MAG: ABC transporter permease [Bacteroidaceae bacterium]|nr:ABC transporter permease [Bacteroidaceae bacterium]